MAERQRKLRTDPELLAQLERAAADDSPVQAVLFLKATSGASTVPGPEEVEGIVKEVLQRVASARGERVPKHNVFRNLGSFVVEAPQGFLRKLLEQGEIASASANQRGGKPDGSKPTAGARSSSAGRRRRRAS